MESARPTEPGPWALAGQGLQELGACGLLPLPSNSQGSRGTVSLGRASSRADAGLEPHPAGCWPPPCTPVCILYPCPQPTPLPAPCVPGHPCYPHACLTLSLASLQRPVLPTTSLFSVLRASALPPRALLLPSGQVLLPPGPRPALAGLHRCQLVAHQLCLWWWERGGPSKWGWEALGLLVGGRGLCQP